jgi:hypothetical protein
MSSDEPKDSSMTQVLAGQGHQAWRDYCRLLEATDEMEALLIAHAPEVSATARGIYREERGSPFMGDTIV